VIRFLAGDAVQNANSGHPGMPLGAAVTAYTLWTKHLRFNPKDPSWLNRDRFILSAGHGSMLLYSLLYLTGYDLSLDEIKRFRQLGSKTPGHPEAHHTPGVEVTTGPLGQGFGNSVGFAIAEAHMGAAYNRDQHIIDHFTYVMCSDGDMMEGVASEAASIAGHLQLGKLIALYDDNKVSLAAATNVCFTEDVAKRFEAYDWHTQYIDLDQGNDVATIDRAISEAKSVTGKPSMIVVRTHIGYGSPKVDSFKSHGEPLGPDDVKRTKENLGWPLEPDFYVPDDVLKFYREVGARRGELQAQWQRTFDEWKSDNGDLAAQLERTLRNQPVHLRNLGANLQAEAMPAAVDLTLRGNRDTLGRVAADDLTAFIDLAGLGPGQYSLTVHAASSPAAGVTHSHPTRLTRPSRPAPGRPPQPCAPRTRAARSPPRCAPPTPRL